MQSRGTLECQDQQWSKAMEEGNEGNIITNLQASGSDLAGRAIFEMGKEDARGQLF